jgi:phage FluMu protein Com
MGWMKNKGVAVVLIIVAVAILGFMYKTQVMPKSVEFDLKAKDGTVCEKVVLPENTQFPVDCPKCKKSSQPAFKYWDNKAKKVIFMTKQDKVEAYMTPGTEAPKRKQ